MANLKEVRTRIASVNSTMQITTAMKMVAASKLRKSQNAIIALRPYAGKLKEIMEDLSASLGKSTEGVYAVVRPAEKILLIPVTSNKGLCGVFNANVIRETQNLIRDEYQQQFDNHHVDIFCIGSKAEEVLRFKKYPVIGSQNEILDNLNYDAVVPFAEKLMNEFSEEKYDHIIFIYNQFKNAGSQELVHEQFLPIQMEEKQETENEKVTNPSDEIEYIFQPNKEEILNELIPKSLKMMVYKILLDSFTSEQGSRMVSMTKATDNAAELLKDLNLTYNKARQSAITNEIVEIVSGADALKG